MDSKGISYWMENYDIVAVIHGLMMQIKSNWIGNLVMVIYSDPRLKGLMKNNMFFETGWLPTKGDHKKTQYDFAISPLFSKQAVEETFTRLKMLDKIEILQLKTSYTKDGKIMVEIILPFKG